MSLDIENNRVQQIARAKEARSLALEFLYTGAVNRKKWSAEVSTGLGATITNIALFEFDRAEAYAEKSITWATNRLALLEGKQKSV